jgi:hypothetical protein
VRPAFPDYFDLQIICFVLQVKTSGAVWQCSEISLSLNNWRGACMPLSFANALALWLCLRRWSSSE